MLRALHVSKAQPCLRMLGEETALNLLALDARLSSGCRGWGELVGAVKIVEGFQFVFTCCHFSIIYILMSLVLYYMK